MLILKRTNSSDNHFLELTACLDKDLQNLYGSNQEEIDQYNIMTNVNTVVLAYENIQAVGCGCFKQMDNNTVELKRMFVKAEHRGKRIGVAILKELENWAVELGYTTIVLETGTLQPEAILLYEKNGYHIIPNYHPYIGNELSVCMKKLITK